MRHMHSNTKNRNKLCAPPSHGPRLLSARRTPHLLLHALGGAAVEQIVIVVEVGQVACFVTQREIALVGVAGEGRAVQQRRHHKVDVPLYHNRDPDSSGQGRGVTKLTTGG